MSRNSSTDGLNSHLVILCKLLLSLPARMPGDLAGHRFTRPGTQVQCESMLVIVWLPGMYARWPEQQINNVGFIYIVITYNRKASNIY